MRPNEGKVANLESMASFHCITLLRHVAMMMISCFDTDYTSLDRPLQIRVNISELLYLGCKLYSDNHYIITGRNMYFMEIVFAGV